VVVLFNIELFVVSFLTSWSKYWLVAIYINRNPSCKQLHHSKNKSIHDNPQYSHWNADIHGLEYSDAEFIRELTLVPKQDLAHLSGTQSAVRHYRGSPDNCISLTNHSYYPIAHSHTHLQLNPLCPFPLLPRK